MATLWAGTPLSTTSPTATRVHINAGENHKSSLSNASDLDEASYARQHLATDGSVFFRPGDKAPRCFLWRILDDRHRLEIQCVDLVYGQPQATTPDARLTFHVTFLTPLRPHCVALADAQGGDGLDVFALTASHHLYTISLSRDLIAHQAPPADLDLSTCVKRFASASFSYKHPYRLVAINSAELFVSFHDGSMLRLERDLQSSAAQWRETHFSEGGWSGTLKRSLPFSKPQTARYGTVDVHSNTIAAIAKSPDGGHIWTVSLDHKLKAWSTQTGAVDLSSDIVHSVPEEDDRKKPENYMMGTEQGTLLQIIPSIIGINDQTLATTNDLPLYSLVLQSPKDHQFKFYLVKGHRNAGQRDRIELQDALPNTRLVPPMDVLMDTNMWHLRDFALYTNSKSTSSQLWLTACSGSTCRTFVLVFNLKGEQRNNHDIQDIFQNGWSEVDASSLSIEKLKTSVEYLALGVGDGSCSTVGEKWLNFLFYPNRFSEASLQTALHIYCRGRQLPNKLTSKLGGNNSPLKERIAGAVSSKVVLRRMTSEQPDYGQYQLESHTQWSAFFSVLSHLHSRRHDSIGFSFDHETGIPWSVSADLIAPVRSCSAFELLDINANQLVSGEISTAHDVVQGMIFRSEEDMITSQIIAAARQLRQYFSAAAQAKLREFVILNSLEQSGHLSGEDGLLAIYNHCHFQDEIRDSDYDAVTEIAEEFNGLGSLTDDNIMMVLERLEDQAELSADAGDRPGPLAQYFAISVAQATLHQTQSTLLDLLTLVVFMHGDLEHDELSKDFHPVEMYEAIMLALRISELRVWLVSRVRLDSSDSYASLGRLKTLYECLFWQDWQSKRNRNLSSLPQLLTAWCTAWTFGLNLSAQWEGITTHVLVDLLKHQEIEFAQDFLKFLPDTWYASYLTGRVQLGAGDFAQAAVTFTNAAVECSTASAPPTPLLSAEEIAHFQTAGKGPYYQHISSLFERHDELSFTIEFAVLALDSLRSDDMLQNALDAIDTKKNSKASGATAKVTNAMDELSLLREQKTKEDLRTRLFHALVQIGQPERAYEVLTHIKNPTVQRSSLILLIETCVGRGVSLALEELPMTDGFIQVADSALLDMAKKSMKLGLPSGPPYQQILFSFRIRHSDFRGAAAILHEHLEHLQRKYKSTIRDPDDDTLAQMYVLLINTLACCGEDEAWLLADTVSGPHAANKKRRLVTLKDIKNAYAAELDRRSDIMQGRFPLIANDHEDEDIF